MLTTTARYDTLVAQDVRPITWKLRAAFDRTFDDNIDFFTLDTSLLDGIDVLAPEGSPSILRWDKFEYTDYSDRLISMEVTKEEEDPHSTVQAYADVTLNNYDGFFNPGSASAIGDFILPRRPFRLLMGFGDEDLPQFVGLSEKMPEIDKQARTARFHLIDFLSYLFDQDISESVIMEDTKTSDVLDYLFQLMGLLPAQYDLSSSINNIKFFYVDKGEKFGPVAKRLMEAEMGRLYLDELGVIRFKNRYSYNLTPVATFDESNVIDYSVSSDSQIINSVKIVSRVLGVQEAQTIWIMPESYFISAGATVEIWAEFADPVTTSVDPIYSATPINDSYFTSKISAEGAAYLDIDFDSIDLFSKSAKLTFTNSGASDALITSLDLWGTPAKVVQGILVEEKDQASITKYDGELPEGAYQIDNEYIQTENDATSRALLLLNDFSDYGAIMELNVKANPALQVGDAVDLNLADIDETVDPDTTHVIQKIENIIGLGQPMMQRLKVKRKTILSWFILDQSLLDGDDVLAP